MNTKNVIALLLALCLMLGLCACGGNSDNNTDTTANTTKPVVTTQATEAIEYSHVVKVVDEGGNPVAGAMIKMCIENDTCFTVMTDDNGLAGFQDLEDTDYSVEIVIMPEGYSYISEEQVFSLPAGSTELTITLQAIA